MRLDFRNERLLAVTAHPDDAELLCAGTLARARDDGAAVAIGVLCRGDKGQPVVPLEDLSEMRRAEMQAAADVLGAELFCGGVSDSTPADDPPTRAKVVDIFRVFRPTLVLAHAPEDYHVDHRAASQLAEAASWLSTSRGWTSPHPPLEAPPAVWWMDTVGMMRFEPQFYVDVTQFVLLKEQMLGCHLSQLQRAGEASFAPLTDLMRLQMQTRGLQSGVAAAEAFRPHLAFKRAGAW